jgi:hypothetical protein
MSPHAMALPVQMMQGAPAGSAGVDPVYWTHDLSSNSLSPQPLHYSPGSNSVAHDSAHSSTPPAQTPQSDSDRKNSEGEQQNSQNGQKNSQKDSGANQTRASVAVACVPCRSRHLKCDGGVRCSRCRADGVECTYIKSRRGWKGKRKNKPEENGAPTVINGTWTELHDILI